MLFSYQALILAHSIGALTVSSTEQGYGEVIFGFLTVVWSVRPVLGIAMK